MEQIKSPLCSLENALGMSRDNPNSFLEILEQEHDLIRRNLEGILNATCPLIELFKEIEGVLNKHMKGEEDLLYPKLEDNNATRQIAFLLYEEHNALKQLLAGMPAASADADRWIAKIRLLNKILTDHVNFEETIVFPKAKEILGQGPEASMREKYENEKARCQTFAVTPTLMLTPP